MTVRRRLTQSQVASLLHAHLGYSPEDAQRLASTAREWVISTTGNVTSITPRENGESNE